MSGILPNVNNGAVIIRDVAGNCDIPENVQGAYCPPVDFTSNCDITALVSDCAAKITPAQINALVSEFLCLAVAMTPQGSWDCNSTCNLSAAFSAWVAELDIDNYAFRDLSNTTGPRGPISPQETQNYNSYLENGWWDISAGTANAPEALQPYILNVQVSNDPSQYTVQYAYAYRIDGESNSWRYKRELNAGVWSPWYRVYETKSDLLSIIAANLPSFQPQGSIIGSAYAEYTANVNLEATIPADDSKPTISEGTQILSVTVTPSSILDKVRLSFSSFGYVASTSIYYTAALFRAGVADAIQAKVSGGSNAWMANDFEVEDAPATTAPVTYTIRVGPSASAILRLNGGASSRLFGGSARATLIAEVIKG